MLDIFSKVLLACRSRFRTVVVAALGLPALAAVNNGSYFLTEIKSDFNGNLFV